MRRNGINLQRWISLGLLLLAGALFFYELLAYSRQRARLPDQMTIAGIPVGGLNQSEVLERLLQVYSTPIELYYNDQLILLSPASIGFRLDTDFMLAAAEFERTNTSFWNGFWDFLWNRPGNPTDIPLRFEYSASQLEASLRDIANRYDKPPESAAPRPGQPFFDPGTAGRVLDISRGEEIVLSVIQSPSPREVNLPIVDQSPARPTMDTLEILLKQNIEVTGFDGLVDLYLKDLRTGESIHFAVLDEGDVPTDPDIAFSAASINKISILTAFFRYEQQPVDPEAQRWLEEMMTVSGNDPSDWLMQRLDPARGPLIVTETLQELGLESTFVSGYYFPGAPLLQIFRTPANQRTDINTGPDPYTQTTPSEIGMLLSDIYACANGGGTLRAVFPDEILPEECGQMLELLSENVLGALLKAGLPDGTRIAHKHGWRSSPLDMIGDTGIVFSPGGDYVISVFLWNDVEMVWEPTSELVADLSRAAYNFFNPPNS
jgi:beta-lactamase class A